MTHGKSNPLGAGDAGLPFLFDFARQRSGAPDPDRWAVHCDLVV